MKFLDRADAGKRLGFALMKYQQLPDTIVFGIARGGMIVARRAAEVLELPLDIKVMVKIKAPSNYALSIGAVSASGALFLNESLMKELGLTIEGIIPMIEAAKQEAATRFNTYNGHKIAWDVKDKTVILIDDGVMTGITMRTAIASAQLHGAKKIVIGVPFATREQQDVLAKEANELICLKTVERPTSIASQYEDCPFVTDEQVSKITSWLG